MTIYLILLSASKDDTNCWGIFITRLSLDLRSSVWEKEMHQSIFPFNHIIFNQIKHSSCNFVLIQFLIYLVTNY